MSSPDNRVEYELWYSSVFDLSLSQIEMLSKYQEPFGNNTLFTPRIFTFSCEFCPESVQLENCISGGKFCPFRPKFDGYGHHDDRMFEITDKEIMMQSLRDRCVYKLIAEED
mmetsp:Transcript_11475/g.19414  ORF Transcript_11475/g.19414 Transcript_11475/m.19414 type:complete len:112 (-) Transcript_11475:670-1005(-)